MTTKYRTWWSRQLHNDAGVSFDEFIVKTTTLAAMLLQLFC
ncbi:hypothetical protein ACW2AB_07225 [Limosilactobacillus fermentum]